MIFDWGSERSWTLLPVIPIGFWFMRADLLALGAIVLWASLATLATLLSNIPPLLLTGIGLIIGSLI